MSTDTTIIPDPTKRWEAAAAARRPVGWDPAADRATIQVPYGRPGRIPDWGRGQSDLAFYPPQMPLFAARWRLDGFKIPGVAPRRVSARTRRYTPYSRAAFDARPVGRATSSPIGELEKALMRLMSINHAELGSEWLMDALAMRVREVASGHVTPNRLWWFDRATATPAGATTKAQRKRVFVAMCHEFDQLLAIFVGREEVKR